MRLDFRNVGKGLEAIAGAKQKRDLARESARYDITEGAYGPELGENVQQVIGMRDQALQGLGEGATPEQRQQVLDQYTPALTELSRRTGLQGPDFSVGSRGANFGTRQEARQAAAPMRAEGLSNVYRQYGDVEEADQLEARAFDQQRSLAQETREQARFDKLQELSGLQLGRARREETAQRRVEAVDSDMSNWMTERLTGDDGTTRAPTTEDTIAAIQHRAGLLSQAGLGDQAAAALQQHLSIAANQIQVQTAERNQALSTVAAGIASGDFASVQDFYDRYIPDGAKVTNIKEGRDGRITISRTTLDNEKLPATTFANRNEMLAALNSVRDPMSLYNYSQQEFKNNIAEQELALKGDELALKGDERSRKQREADAKPSVAAQRIYDVLKNTDSFKRAIERGEIAEQRRLLADAGIPRSELYKFGVEEPPGGGTMDESDEKGPAATTTTVPAAGLTRPPAPRPTLLEAFGINDPNSALARTFASKIEAVQAAGDGVKAAQARVVAVGPSGDRGAIDIALADLQQQTQNLNRLLADESNAEPIRRALRQ